MKIKESNIRNLTENISEILAFDFLNSHFYLFFEECLWLYLGFLILPQEFLLFSLSLLKLLFLLLEFDILFPLRLLFRPLFILSFLLSRWLTLLCSEETKLISWGISGCKRFYIYSSNPVLMDDVLRNLILRELFKI